MKTILRFGFSIRPRDNFRQKQKLEPSYLLGILILSFLFSAVFSPRPAHSAPEPCVSTGPNEITCTGNQSTGIASGSDFSSPPVTTLNINNLSEDIFPESGTSGVVLENSTGSDITINYETDRTLLTQGDNAPGIEAKTQGERRGSVTVASDGTIITTGNNSSGILAESRVKKIEDDDDGKDDVDDAIVDLGNGNVTVTARGKIVTLGTQAHGIHAKSFDGGPDVEDSPTSDEIGEGSSRGNVIVNHQGNILALGNESHGILAESQGNKGGAVDVTVDGNVIAEGENSDGIVAQSLGENGAGQNMTVTVEKGTVQGGTGSAAAVRFAGGLNNTLNSHGTIISKDGILGMAILGGDQNETINNQCSIVGEVDLGAGANAFNNLVGSHFSSGARVYLGNGNILTNAGTIAPGGTGNMAVTTITGNLDQTDSGALEMDVDFASGETDLVVVTGAADLAGKVIPHADFSGGAAPGTFASNIVWAGGGVTNSGLELWYQSSAVVQYQLVYPNATDVVLVGSLDFSPSGLNINQTAIGDYFNRIQMGGGSAELAPLVASLMGLPDVDRLAAAYDQLSPEVYTGLQTNALFSNMNFSEALLSCREKEGEFRFIREGECAWMRLTGRDLKQDSTFQTIGFDGQGYELSGGMQKALNKNYVLGFGLSYENTNLDAGASETRGNQFQGGAVLKGRYGPTLVSMSLSGGYGWHRTDRLLNIPVPGVLANSHQGVGFVGTHARVAYLLEEDAYYLKPMVSTGVTYLNLGSFRETGAGAANLIVNGTDELYWSWQPAVEVGGEWTYKENNVLRTHLKVGVTQFLGDTNPEITALLQGAPIGVAPFRVSGRMDRTFAEVDTGVDLIRVDGVVFRLQYLGRFSSKTRQHQGALKVSAPLTFF